MSENTMASLPQNKEAEKALLGSILMQPEIIKEISITPDYFHSLQNRDLWMQMQAIYNSGKDVDSISLMANPKFDMNHYMDVTCSVGSSYNWETYLAILKDCKTRRDAIRTATKLMQDAFDMENPLADKIPAHMNSLLSVAQVQSGVQPIAETMKATIALVEERAQHPCDIWGIPTGLTDVDNLTGGLQLGETFVLTGQPGLGKSWFCMQLVRSAAKNGYPVAIYELEMSQTQTGMREIQRSSNVRTKTMKTGKMDSSWEAFYQGASDISTLPIYASYDPYWTTMAIRADLTRAVAQYGIKMAMIDHTKLLCDSGESETSKETAISNAFTRMAKELNIHILLIDVLGKEGMKAGEPSMANIKGSSQTPYNANVMAQLMTRRDEQNQIIKSQIKLVFTKIREGDEEASREIDLIRPAGNVDFYCVTRSAQEYKR